MPNIYGRNPKVKRLQSKKESFGSLYRIKLEPILLKLDKERRVILVRLVLRRSMSIVLLLIYILYNINVEEETGEPLADWGVENISFWLIFFLTHIFMHVKYPTEIDDYHKSFKKEIVTRLVKFFDKSSVYKAKPNHKQRISMAKGFAESEIFGQWYPFNYQGELDDNADREVGGTVYNISDFVSWQIGNTKIEFSMLACSIVGKEKQFHDKGDEDYTHIFGGIFYSVDFNKNFAGKTFVLVDVAQADFGLIGQELQSVLGGNKELVRLENEEFEEQFVVYSDDQIEARNILSPTLMEKIVKFQNTCFGRIQMSFVKNKLHIAIRYSYDMVLFEPKLYTSILKSNDIQEYYENLTWIGDLVEELNLNRRIWGKVKADNT